MSLAGENPDLIPKPKLKVKVITGTFCTFDCISGRDFRVEITFPGSTNIVAISADGQRHPIDGKEWSNVFLCSQLRAFKAVPCYVARVIQELPSIEMMSDLLYVTK